MPSKPPSPCRERGCPAVVDGGGYCDTHRKDRYKRHNAKRRASKETTDAFYWSSAWRNLRAVVLYLEPLCRTCKEAGRTTVAECVDHIIPMKRGGAALDRANLQPLCNACHSRKTIAEGSAF
jgi:5-methylcytosine-specific restriction protein A